MDRYGNYIAPTHAPQGHCGGDVPLLPPRAPGRPQPPLGASDASPVLLRPLRPQRRTFPPRPLWPTFPEEDLPSQAPAPQEEDPAPTQATSSTAPGPMDESQPACVLALHPKVSSTGEGLPQAFLATPEQQAAPKADTTPAPLPPPADNAIGAHGRTPDAIMAEGLPSSTLGPPSQSLRQLRTLLRPLSHGRPPRTSLTPPREPPTTPPWTASSR